MLNSVAVPNVSTSNRFAPLARREVPPSVHDDECPGPSRPRPSAVANARTERPTVALQLTPGEHAIRQAIEDSGAPERDRVIACFTAALADAGSDEARAAVVTKFQRLLLDREAASCVLPTLLLNVLNTGLSRVALRTVAEAAPAVGAALSLAQLAQSVWQRSWREVAAALPTLVTMLPSLRQVQAFDALIQSMPDALRSQLDALHRWVQETDDAMTPDLQLQHLGPALAVAAVLWQVKQRLPSPSRQLQGVAGFIANLPQHWQRLVTVDRLGASLLAAPAGMTGSLDDERIASTRARLSDQEKAERVAQKKWADRRHLPGFNATEEPPIHSLDADPAPVLPSASLDAAVAPGRPAEGGTIAMPPEQPQQDATSGIGSVVSSFWAVLTGITATACTQLPQDDLGEELTLMRPAAEGDPGIPLDQISVHTPLMDNVVPTAAGGLVAKGVSRIRQNPLVAATTLLFTAGGAVASSLYHLWPSPPESLSTLDVVEKLSAEIVSLGDAWGTGLDLLLGVPELQGSARRKRDVSNNQSGRLTSAPPTDNTEQLGISKSQQDALLADNGLKNHLRSLQTWSLAVAKDLATQDGWRWVAQLPASEQELLVTQLHALRQLIPALASLQQQAQAQLDQILVAAGWSEGADGVTVDLGSTDVAGVTVNQQMPLMEYCLLRADGTHPPATFLRGGQPLGQTEHNTLLKFVHSQACATLGDDLRTQAELLRPALVDATKAQLVVDAIRAKSDGTLSGNHLQLRGAEIVLGYLQGKADVESATLTYSDTLADGTAISFNVPNYLVLRSASTDPDLHGQVVLYRSDLASFQSFDSETAFREFLDTQRATAGLHVVNGAIDPVLINHIVNAAPPAYRTQVRERVAAWESRYVLHQTGRKGPQAWNPSDSFVLAFQPCTVTGNTLDDWAGTLVNHSRTLQQQQLEAEQLRWSSLGQAQVATDDALATAMREDMQTLQRHARPAVMTALMEALRRAGFLGDTQNIDPDQLVLRVNGHTMSVTAWATSGWQQHGLSRPILPTNLGDLPGEGFGPPANPLPLLPWPSEDALSGMTLTAHQVDDNGARHLDEDLTAQLENEDVRRAICGMLADFAGSNELADAYTAHLKQLAARAGSAIHTAVANQIRVHTAWMIELAYRSGVLDKAAYTALMREQRAMDPTPGRGSSLQAVTLNGHVISGVWALKAKGTHYVFLPGTSVGDQLLDEAGFRRWLKEPEAEDYVLAHSPLRYHTSLRSMFNKKETRNGIALGFNATRGPQRVAQRYIQDRISDVDEMTTSQLERFTDALTIVASVVAALSCSMVTAGAAAGACLLSTGVILADAFVKGMDLIDRKDIDGAIEQIGGGVLDALDVLDVLKIPGLLFQLGRRGLNTVAEATDALRQWQRQASGFTADGRVNEAFATSRQSLSDTGLPMLEYPLPDGGTLHMQGGREYIQQNGKFVESYVAKGEDGRRLRMPEAPGEAGPPVEYRDGHWQRAKQTPEAGSVTTPRTSGARGPTTPLPPETGHAWVEKVPEAQGLSSSRLDELEAVFGIRRAGTTPSPDLRQKVRDLAMKDRIQQIVNNPDSLGAPGDEAIITRAWADSPALGNGRSVETYTVEQGEWNRGVRFGTGPVGTRVEVGNSRQLPSIQMLIDASDIDALMTRLGLPSGSTPDQLHRAVRTELAKTIEKDQGQSLLSWQRWMNAQHSLPTAADNLIKHYPQLTKMEAEALVASDRVLQNEVVNWIFSRETASKVAEVLARRNKREQREAVLEGNLNSPSKVMELEQHLQNVLPGRSWSVGADPSGEGSVLSFTPSDENGNTFYSLTFSTGGQVHRSTTSGKQPVSSWEQGIYELLSPEGKQTVTSSDALRNSVVERMKITPLESSCNLPPMTRGHLVKRGLECDPPPTISLSQRDIEERDSLDKEMRDVRARMAEKHAHLLREEAEYRQLAALNMQLKQEKKTLDPKSLARLRELEQKDLGSVKGFENMNFASYQLEGLSYNGIPVTLNEKFPAHGTAPSGSPRPSLATGGVVEGVPVRRVLIPEEIAFNNIEFSGWYREDYAMGADLTRIVVGRYVEPNQGSTKIVLGEKDLLVTKPGTKKKVPIHTLTDDEILLLDSACYSPNLRKYIGDAGLLPSNARTLKPGEYRMYQIRSCSEGKILDNLFDALEISIPGISPMLRGKSGDPITSLSGKLYIISEMNPCAVSCDRRLEEATKLLGGAQKQGLEILVFYLYDNNTHRQSWILEQKLGRVIDKYRDAWEAEGLVDVQMRDRAALEMRKPEVLQWLEEDIRHRPLSEPVARLWVPNETKEF